MRAKPGPVRCGIALALLLSLVIVLPVGADATDADSAD